MGQKIFLGLSTLVWVGYGLYCFFQPAFLADMPGLVANTPAATTELRAMYGGVQLGIGLLCAAALARPELARTALLCMLFVVGGLATTRLLGALMDGSFGTYTNGGLAFELLIVAASYFLLPRDRATA